MFRNGSRAIVLAGSTGRDEVTDLIGTVVETDTASGAEGSRDVLVRTTGREFWVKEWRLAPWPGMRSKPRPSTRRPSGPKLAAGYAHELTAPRVGNFGNPDEDWETVMLTASDVRGAVWHTNRTIDGVRCSVFVVKPSGKVYAQSARG